MTIDAPVPQGEIAFKNVPAQRGITGGGGATVGPGRWALNSKSTIPYARIKGGWMGTRDITWGESFSVPPGHQAAIESGSFHDGDIWLTTLLDSDTPPMRPCRVTIPADLVLAGAVIGKAQQVKTNYVDTRIARRVFLAVPAIALGFTPTVNLDAPTKGHAVPNGAPSTQNSGVVVYTFATVGPTGMVALGIGTNLYVDTAGNTVPELRPMALLDRLFVNASQSATWTPGIEAYFVIEYL